MNSRNDQSNKSGKSNSTDPQNMKDLELTTDSERAIVSTSNKDRDGGGGGDGDGSGGRNASGQANAAHSREDEAENGRADNPQANDGEFDSLNRAANNDEESQTGTHNGETQDGLDAGPANEGSDDTPPLDPTPGNDPSKKSGSGAGRAGGSEIR